MPVRQFPEEMRRVLAAAGLGIWCAAFNAALPCPASAQAPRFQFDEKCEVISDRIEQYQAAVRSPSGLSGRDRGELSIVLHEACSKSFEKCKFPICEALLVRQRSGGTVGPLSWLNQDLKCEEFIRQVQLNYSKLGKYSDLPEQKRIEVRYVLDVACSMRFDSCNFQQCRPQAVPPAERTESDLELIAGTMAREAEKLASSIQQPDAAPAPTLAPAASAVPVSTAPARSPSPVPTQAAAAADPPPVSATVETLEDKAVQQAITEYERVLREDQAKRLAMIEIAVEEEAKQRWQWKRLGIADELEVVEERRKRSKEDNLKNRGEGEDDGSPFRGYLKNSGKAQPKRNPASPPLKSQSSGGGKAAGKDGSKSGPIVF